MVVTVNALVVFTDDITVDRVGVCDSCWGISTNTTIESTTCDDTTEVEVGDGWVECKRLGLDSNFIQVLRTELNDAAQVGCGQDLLDIVVGTKVRHRNITGGWVGGVGGAERAQKKPSLLS